MSINIARREARDEMRIGLATAILSLPATPALPHRLDEYLQGTIVSVEKDRVQFQMTLTPGVAISQQLIAQIDRNSDGAISRTEANAYPGRVLRRSRIITKAGFLLGWE